MRRWSRLRVPGREEAAAEIVAPPGALLRIDIDSRLARDEAALRLLAEHGDELGAIIGFLAERLVGDDDRGARQGGRRDTIEHILRNGDAVERVFGVVGILDADHAPAQARVALRHRREDMGADRPAGIADRDRNLDRGIEHLAAAVRRRLVGVAPHVKLLRGAADVDRDRLDRELRVKCCPGGVGFFLVGRLGDILGRRRGVELRLRVGLGGVELRCCVRGLGSGLLLQVLGLGPCLIRLCRGQHLVGERKLGIGALLEIFQLAQCRRDRGGLARRGRHGFLRLISRFRSLSRLAGERLGTRRSRRDGLRVRHQQRRVGNLDRGGVVRRDDDPHPEPRLVEHFFRKAVRHADTAMRGGVAGQRSAMQRNAVPGDALHVRHLGIVIEGGAVLLFLLDDGKDAGRRLPARGSGRDRRADDPAVGVVEHDVLGLDRHDRHDRLTGLAWRRLLGGCRLCLWRRGLGGQRCQRGHRRDRHNGGSPRRPIAKVMCGAINRIPMPAPVEMPVQPASSHIRHSCAGERVAWRRTARLYPVSMIRESSRHTVAWPRRKMNGSAAVRKPLLHRLRR